MLHEILLSLSGHPSPLLRSAGSTPDADDLSGRLLAALTPPERDLLASLAQLGAQYARLATESARLTTTHPSTVVRAVAAAASAGPLTAFRRTILDAEASILRRDPSLVGASNTVPLTALVNHFAGWNRRMDWVWDVVIGPILQGLEIPADGLPSAATIRSAATLIGRLRVEIVSGYADVEAIARGLLVAAEQAWLKQVTAWVLYGRLPGLGESDFFVQMENDGDYIVCSELLPAFVPPEIASSILFIGRCLNHGRVRTSIDSATLAARRDRLPARLSDMAGLASPFEAASLGRVIAAVRLDPSRDVLQRLLPTRRVIEVLQLLRDFLLLDRGEFAVALVHEADERTRGRWRVTGPGPGPITVKEGEAAAVLAKTWAVMGTLVSHDADDDDGLDLARDLVRLVVLRTDRAAHPVVQAAAPFCSLLLGSPAALTVRIPPPLDMFLSETDVLVYSAINAYLLAIRRAHIRLTALWKVSALRRHHPAPPSGGRAAPAAALLRLRHTARAAAMREPWASCTAAVFFLAQTEAFLQAEVLARLWDAFRVWLDQPPPPPDPQTLAAAHRALLAALPPRLLLTRPAFAEPLHRLLLAADHLAALVLRRHEAWTAHDLTAAPDPDDEDGAAATDLRAAGARVRAAVAAAVAALRTIEADVADDGEAPPPVALAAAVSRLDLGLDTGPASFVPPRSGGVARLLMTLDMGGWLDGTPEE